MIMDKVRALDDPVMLDRAARIMRTALKREPASEPFGEATITDIRRCGRPKKDTTPCQAILHHPASKACKTHETDVDRAYLEGWGAGSLSRLQSDEEIRKSAYDSGLAQGRREVVREQERKDNFRVMTPDGSQIVEVNGYAYTWEAEQEPLKMGDEVWLPPNWLIRKKTRGVVTALGTSYTGALSRVLCRASADNA
jgi:hypothetical protein